MDWVAPYSFMPQFAFDLMETGPSWDYYVPTLQSKVRYLEQDSICTLKYKDDRYNVRKPE